jgi:predicted  nucleic acid-binding Zn-ribbon protein
MRITKAVDSMATSSAPTEQAAIERELTKLEKRRLQVAEALDAATQNAIQASALRREVIIANRDQETLEQASAKVRAAEEQRVALDNTVRALDQHISELISRHDGRNVFGAAP